MASRASTIFARRRAIVSLLAISVLVFVGYYPSIRVGFLGDDWWFLGKAASLDLPAYLAFYFDPRLQIFWYRPLYGILLLGEYFFFRGNPDGYHLIQITLHSLNAFLLYAVVWQFSKNWRLAFLSALFYTLLPVNNLAIFWIAVQDPLALVFYLGAIWMWIIYLQSASRFHYTLAVGAFVLALLGKEASVFLPVTLFLIDRMLFRKNVSLSQLIQRYAVFGIVLVGYLGIEYVVQKSAYFPNRWGYGIGWHVIENLLHYFALVIFPWGQDGPIIYVALAIGLGALGAVGVKHRRALVLFLVIQTLLTIAPALGFPVIFFQARYLYFASIISAILLALLFETIWKKVARRSWSSMAFALAVIGVTLTGAALTMSASAERVEEGRRMRVPLRDIYQQHPMFPNDTYLYFVEPPYPMIMRNLYGMFFLRYGSAVTVWSNDAEWGGVDEDRVANLRDHQNTIVEYFDSSATRHEVIVDRDAQSVASPTLPIAFQAPLKLEGYEITHTKIKRGDDWALLLYWRAQEKIAKDYTVFVHLVNANGEIVDGADTQPRGGRLPTTKWAPRKLVVDGHLLTIGQDVPPGKYRVEIGLYDLATLERLMLVDDTGRVIADKLVVESIEVVE